MSHPSNRMMNHVGARVHGGVRGFSTSEGARVLRQATLTAPNDIFHSDRPALSGHSPGLMIPFVYNYGGIFGVHKWYGVILPISDDYCIHLVLRRCEEIP